MPIIIRLEEYIQMPDNASQSDLPAAVAAASQLPFTIRYRGRLEGVFYCEVVRESATPLADFLVQAAFPPQCFDAPAEAPPSETAAPEEAVDLTEPAEPEYAQAEQPDAGDWRPHLASRPKAAAKAQPRPFGKGADAPWEAGSTASNLEDASWEAGSWKQSKQRPSKSNRTQQPADAESHQPEDQDESWGTWQSCSQSSNWKRGVGGTPCHVCGLVRSEHPDKKFCDTKQKRARQQ